MQASKLTRVRKEGFSNSRAIIRPGNSGSRSPFSHLLFRSSVMEKMRSISAAVRSANVSRCRIVSLPEGIRDWGLGIRFCGETCLSHGVLIPNP